MVIVALALTVLLGCAALSVDIGRVMLAAERTQNVSDAAALAAGPVLPDSGGAMAAAYSMITPNNVNVGDFKVTCNFGDSSGSSDILYYGPDSTIPGFGPLGPATQAVTVTCHMTIQMLFAGALGIQQKEISNRSIMVYGPLHGVPIVPMWISSPTPYEYGQSQNLLMADGPHCAGIAGNFGFLELPSACSATWTDMMEGTNITEADREACYATVGDVWSGYPGLKTGQWTAALQARIDYATQTWPNDTFANHDPANTHIMLVPLVSYVGSSGTNATYQIEAFGAWWLDSIDQTGTTKSINGRFLHYSVPGDVDVTGPDTGIYGYRLVG